MLSKKMRKKIRKVEIKSNRLVEEIFSGEYRSGFRGKGIEFDDIRQYNFGDDVRSIDWNVTARQNRPYIKQYQEERELNIYLLVDLSHSSNFGRKMDIIVELSATLAFSAIKNNDKVGALLFTDRVEKFVPSRNGRKHVLSIIHDILVLEPEHRGTDPGKALEYFNRVEKKQSIVFLISDFLADGFEKELKITDRKHDLVLLRIIDPAEERLPAGAIFAFEDMETGETVFIDNLRGDREINAIVNLPKKKLINIYTDEDFVKPLKYFFKRRG